MVQYIQYSKFRVRKQDAEHSDILVKDREGKYLFIMCSDFLCSSEIEDLYSGDEKLAMQVLDSYLSHLKYEVDKIEYKLINIQ